MIVAVPPKIAVARFIGQVKAVASVRFNRLDLGFRLSWQEEYSVLSLSKQALPSAIAYVQGQKARHSRGSG
jgi:hypothetical protein